MKYDMRLSEVYSIKGPTGSPPVRKVAPEADAPERDPGHGRDGSGVRKPLGARALVLRYAPRLDGAAVGRQPLA